VSAVTALKTVPPVPKPLKIIVIPTYDESDNIEPLVRSIMALHDEFYILVVDDNSPDGTGDIAEDLARSCPRLSVLHRYRDRGLGRSYVDGMKLAIQRGADLVLQMDADFSHPPRFLPTLAAKAMTCDMVIGSRYCPGGGIEGWALHRRALSRMANLYVRCVLGLTTADNTGAFRCWRAGALARIDLDRIMSDGYAFLVETANAARRLGLRIREVPIVFVDRREGQSKLSRRVILESVAMPWRLALRRATPRDREPPVSTTPHASVRY